MSEETLKIVVPFFTAVLVAFITFFLTRSHYERKRQDDLADRDYKRRTERLDKKIEETQEYFNMFSDATRLLVRCEVGWNLSGNFKEYKSQLDQISELTNLALKKMPSVFGLRNSELAGLHEEMLTLFNTEQANALLLLSQIGRKEILDKDAIADRLSEFNRNINTVIGKSLYILEKLE
jgi:hypothetical protein